MKTRTAKALLLWLLLSSAPVLFAETYPEGLWQGYDGEWKHVSQQLIALAEATPSEKFAWRPAPGVRSTSEVYMHIVMANFYLLSVIGPQDACGPPGRCGKNGNVQGRSDRLAETFAGRSQRRAFGCKTQRP